MKIENIKDDKKGVFLYQTNDFVTIQIKFLFEIPDNKKSIVTSRILSQYLTKTNKKYKTYKTITNKLKEFYDMSIRIRTICVGKQNFLSFEVELLDPKYIEEDYLKDAIKFAKEILFNPNFDSNSLDNETFEYIKNDLINKENINISNPKVINERLLFSNMIPQSNLSKNLFTDIEEFKNIVNSITQKDIIDFYHKIIEKSFYKGYVFGNVSDKEFTEIRKAFQFTSNNKKVDYIDRVELPKGYKEIVNNDIKQSNLYVVYDINDYNPENTYLYKTLSYMLNTGNGLCHKVLRTELGIVYSAYSIYNPNMGYLYIRADISKENKEKCLNGIDDIINRLKNPKIVKDLLEYAIEKQNQNDYASEEIFIDNLRDLEDYIFYDKQSREELSKRINRITVEDIINQINNLEKKYVYFYKGDKE